MVVVCSANSGRRRHRGGSLLSFSSSAALNQWAIVHGAAVHGLHSYTMAAAATTATAAATATRPWAEAA